MNQKYHVLSSEGIEEGKWSGDDAPHIDQTPWQAFTHESVRLKRSDLNHRHFYLRFSTTRCPSFSDSIVTTMLSDYGSDILSDDIDAIESSQPLNVQTKASVTSPRQPLRERNANLPVTPPPSQRKRDEVLSLSQYQLSMSQIVIHSKTTVSMRAVP